MAMKIADLFGLLGIRVDRKQMRQAREEVSRFAKESKRETDGVLDGLNKTMRRVAMGVGAYFGARGAAKAFIGFNSTVEDSKNLIAGMLALTKKTDLADQLKNADDLYASLQKRAAVLPGTTQDYINMLTMITRPLTGAGAGLKQLEDMTVQATVAAQAFQVPWEVAARDIQQGLAGRYSTVDMFNKILLEPMGYEGEEGRSKFNALSKKQKLDVYQKALGQKQIKQLGEAQGKTFSGVFSTLKDSLQQFLGKVGLPLFRAMKDLIVDLNAWVDANKEKLQAVGEVISTVLTVAFEAVKVAASAFIAVIAWLVDHGDFTIALLTAIGAVLIKIAVGWIAVRVAAIAAWIAMHGPILVIIAAIAALVFIVIKVAKLLGLTGEKFKAMFRAAWNAAKDFLRNLLRIPGAIADAFWSAIDAIAKWFAQLWEDVKAGARKAWAAIKDIPVIGHAIQAVEGGVSIIRDPRGAMKTLKGAAESVIDQTRSTTDAIRPNSSLPPPSGATGNGPVSQVNGDVNINVNGAMDPEAVAVAVQRQLDRTLLHAIDDLGLPSDTNGVA